MSAEPTLTVIEGSALPDEIMLSQDELQLMATAIQNINAIQRDAEMRLQQAQDTFDARLFRLCLTKQISPLDYHFDLQRGVFLRRTPTAPPESAE